MEHGFTSRYGFWFRCGCAAEEGHTYRGRVGVVCVVCVAHSILGGLGACSHRKFIPYERALGDHNHVKFMTTGV